MGRVRTKIDLSILQSVSEAFAVYRRTSSRSPARTPDHLKKLALKAVVQCGSRSSVAEAAGVTPKTLSNWKAAIQMRESPVELSVVQDALVPSSVVGEPTDIQIHFQTGIRMQLRLSALSPEFVQLLNGRGSYAVG